jgi:hypothetical protein
MFRCSKPHLASAMFGFRVLPGSRITVSPWVHYLYLTPLICSSLTIEPLREIANKLFARPQ